MAGKGKKPKKKASKWREAHAEQRAWESIEGDTDGLRQAKSFLNARGFDVDLRAFHRREDALTSWMAIARRVAGEDRAGPVMESVLKNLGGSNLPLRAAKGRDGVVLKTHARKVAYVFGDHAAHVEGVFRIWADFLKPGKHWEELREALSQPDELTSAVEGESMPSPRPARVLASMPATVSTAVRALANQASARIRLERTLAFGHKIVVKTDAYELVFSPIKTQRSHIEEPFEFRRHGGDAVHLALRLDSGSDPLPLVVSGAADHPDVIIGWLIGLVAFADLTCGQASADRTVAPVRDPQHRRPGRPPPHPAQQAPRRPAPPNPRRPTGWLTDNLEPVGATAAHAASYVAGHRRHLGGGRTCSDEARAFGIALREGETWVRPHARGLPHGASLEFRWAAPAAIATL